MTYTETAKTTFAAPAKFNLVKWLLCLDASFHEAIKLKNTEDRYLKDMRITRQQANVAFYRQFADKSY